MGTNARTRRERMIEAARGYLVLDMPDHALKELGAIKDPEKSPFVIHQLRGEALRQKQEHDSALRAFERALAEDPADLSVLLGMAWCYKRTDQLPKAVEAMEQAYRASPKEAIILYNLACYLALAGDKTHVLSWLGRALRMEPSLRQLISDESDFDLLRDDPDFQFVAGTLDMSDFA